MLLTCNVACIVYNGYGNYAIKTRNIKLQRIVNACESNSLKHLIGTCIYTVNGHFLLHYAYYLPTSCFNNNSRELMSSTSATL